MGVTRFFGRLVSGVCCFWCWETLQDGYFTYLACDCGLSGKPVIIYCFLVYFFSWSSGGHDHSPFAKWFFDKFPRHRSLLPLWVGDGSNPLLALEVCDVFLAKMDLICVFGGLSCSQTSKVLLIGGLLCFYFWCLFGVTYIVYLTFV